MALFCHTRWFFLGAKKSLCPGPGQGLVDLKVTFFKLTLGNPSALDPASLIKVKIELALSVVENSEENTFPLQRR